MKQIHRFLAGITALALLVCPAAPALAAENGHTVYIQCVDDLIALSNSCAVDQWSQGKTVVLDADLDLTGSAFSPIPTFGGTFDGQGHTISGLSITGSGNVRGLFRYVQADGVVKNLTVVGSIDPEDRQDSLGLVAGSNSGRIAGCQARGAVRGKNCIGGIAGVNEAGGEIINCTFTGALTGEHSAGGIAGENHGTLTQCENGGSINTGGLADALEIESVDWKKINSTENVPDYTDIGGVVGLSDGVLQSCRNTGAVGYEHIGYNVGGIAGRQSGYLDGCLNTGKIQGRKDVGGIVGQLEPEVIRKFSEDFLENLLNESDMLLEMMDRTLRDVSDTSDSLSTQMQTMSDKARVTKDIAGNLMDAMTDWTNGSIDQANELSARLSWTIGQMEPIMDKAAAALETIEDAAGQMDDVLDQMETAADQMNEAADGAYDALDRGRDAMYEMRRGLDDLQNGMDNFRSAGDGVRQALKKLGSALGDPDAVSTAVADLLRAMERFESAFGAMSESGKHMSVALEIMDDVGETMMDAMDISMDAMDSLRDAMDLLGKAGDTMDDALSGMTDMTGDIQDMVRELADKPAIEIAPIGSDVTDQGDALDAAMDALLDEGDALNELMRAASDTMVDDMQAIGAQLRVILRLIRQEKSKTEQTFDESPQDRIRDHFEDVSELGGTDSQHDGRVSASRNEGAVNGDVNAGGIAGAVSVEYDFDPEDDLKKAGEYSLEYTYKAKGVLFSCVNAGQVTAKRDYAGGIAGCMDMGLVSACENYGKVASTDGSYVGGIAGVSYSTIQNSWVKCSLSGTDYIGGIAGLGSTLKSCHTLVRIENGSAYLGAIAGDADNEDGDAVVSGNTFTSEELGGVDGISYVGKAEPVSFDTLCMANDVPAAFAQLELTFIAGDRTVAVIPFQYGEGIKSLPEIPARKGYYAAWPEIDYTHLTASHMLEAIYTPYRSALSEGGDFPVILVDGTFSGNAVVSHTTAPVAWSGQDGASYTGTAYTVSVEDPDFREISCTIHYRLPEGGHRYRLWVQTDDGWEMQDFSIDGSYLLFRCEDTPVTFCVVEQSGNWLRVVAVIGAVIVAVAVIVFVWIKRRKKRTPKKT